MERPIGPAAGDAVTNVLPPLQIHLPSTEDPQEPEYPLTKCSLSPSFLYPSWYTKFATPSFHRQTQPRIHQGERSTNAYHFPPTWEGLSHRAVHQWEPGWTIGWLATNTRNTWSKEEHLIQLDGHLQGTALQEWNLLTAEEKSNWDTAVKALRGRLEPRDRALATQNFWHATQKNSKTMADYICRMERAFQLAYGWDGMLRETRETMLLTQLQESLLYWLVKSPAPL